MKTFIPLFTLLFILFAGQVQAKTNSHSNSVPIDPVSSFKKVILVPSVDTLVPIVVEVPLLESVVSGERFLVRERETGAYLGSYLRQEASVKPIDVVTQTAPYIGSSERMVDGQLDTYLEFPVPDDGRGTTVITIQLSQSITTSKLNLHLAQYVSLPLTVQIKTRNTETPNLTTIVATKRMTGPTVTFPEVTASIFEITFTYAQPLRISELNFVQKNLTDFSEQSLRFLAQPNYSYEVYYQADQSVSVQTSESGNLVSNDNIMVLAAYQAQPNPLYTPADIDGDGIRDTLDNCVRVKNTNQIDVDANGRGDVCDDFDRDGIINSIDNCVNIPNRNQSDEDGDGIGDACDKEESRFTEQNPWIPWVGMGTAGALILLLFMLVAKGPKQEVRDIKESNIDNGSPSEL